MSNSNGLQGLTCWATSFWNLLGLRACLQFGQSPCNDNQECHIHPSFWLACTEYRLAPYSPCMWFKTRFNIHNATKFTTLSTFLGHYSFPRREWSKWALLYCPFKFCSSILRLRLVRTQSHLCSCLKWSSTLRMRVELNRGSFAVENL